MVLGVWDLEFPAQPDLVLYLCCREECANPVVVTQINSYDLDHLSIILRAEIDLIVGLTACSAEKSNNYKFKPIGYEISGG